MQRSVSCDAAELPKAISGGTTEQASWGTGTAVEIVNRSRKRTSSRGTELRRGSSGYEFAGPGSSDRIRESVSKRASTTLQVFALSDAPREHIRAQHLSTAGRPADGV